jgi:hypothetical protein
MTRLAGHGRPDELPVAIEATRTCAPTATGYAVCNPAMPLRPRQRSAGHQHRHLERQMPAGHGAADRGGPSASIHQGPRHTTGSGNGSGQRHRRGRRTSTDRSGSCKAGSSWLLQLALLRGGEAGTAVSSPALSSSRNFSRRTSPAPTWRSGTSACHVARVPLIALLCAGYWISLLVAWPVRRRGREGGPTAGQASLPRGTRLRTCSVRRPLPLPNSTRVPSPPAAP